MKREVSVVLLVLYLIPAVYTQYACFKCSSSWDDRCGDYFQPLVPSYQCMGTCLKYRGERWSNGVRIVEVNRLCGEVMKEGCVDGVMYNGISTRRCACNANLCNHGNKAYTSGTLAFLASTVSFMHYGSKDVF